MAITLEANYSKKLGLPQFSSHQYSVTVRTEIADLSSVQAESERLYLLLQGAVDREIQETGWLPGEASHSTSPNDRRQATPQSSTDWNCTEKQRSLILKLVEENGLDRNRTDDLARERFGNGVRQLNRLEASAFIDELFNQCGARPAAAGRKHPAFRSGRGAK